MDNNKMSMNNEQSSNIGNKENNDLNSRQHNNGINKEDSTNKVVTKKEKAQEASKDVAEVAARVLARYYGGAAGGAAVDRALQTKSGQKILRKASNAVAKAPVARGILANNQNTISSLKPLAHSVVDRMGGKKGDSTSSGNTSKGSFKTNESGNISKLNVIIIIIIAFFLFTIIFIVIFIAPLMTLGIIDIESIGSSGGNISSGPISEGFTSISDSASYWWPVDSDNSTITSPYGQRLHPIQKVWKMHNGIDIAISGGASPGVINILASNSGIVTKIITGCPTTNSDNDKSDNNCGGGYGNYIIVKHNDEQSTLYAHLYSINVSQGSRVNKGQIIGTMGSSGNSTGTHLHFEVRVNGNRQNPTNFVSITNRKP